MEVKQLRLVFSKDEPAMFIDEESLVDNSLRSQIDPNKTILIQGPEKELNILIDLMRKGKHVNDSTRLLQK